MATIQSICYQPSASLYEEPYRFNRVPLTTANLIANHGIEGDFKAGRNPNRQLNIMSVATLLDLKAEGYRVAAGEMGEQLVIAELDVMAFDTGTRLKLGETAIIELTKPRTGCIWLGLVQDKPDAAEATINRLGMMARVLQGGVIRVGDEVAILTAN